MRGTIVRIGITGAGALLAIGLLAPQPAGATGSGRQGQSERSEKASCFTASGTTQGRSHSDPDGMSNGGPDKPGCPGGFDADKDGNNGCGNDADREDDNNGRCGRQKAEREDRVNVQRAKVEADRKARCDRRTGATTTSTTATTAPTTVSAAGSAQECSCPKTEVPVSAAAVKLQAASAALPSAEADSTTTTTTTSPATVSAAGDTSPAGVEAAATPATPGTEVLGETLERPSALPRTGAGVGGLALLGGLLCGGGRLAVLARRFLRIG